MAEHLEGILYAHTWLAEKVRQYMNEHHIGERKMGKLLGISTTCVRNLLQGKLLLFMTLERVTTFFGYNMDIYYTIKITDQNGNCKPRSDEEI